MNVHQEIAELRRENDYLRCQIEQVSAEREAIVRRLLEKYPKLTKSTARIVYALRGGKLVDREQLAALCCHADDADPRLIDSQIKRLRRAMPRLQILSVYGVGYRLADESVPVVKAMCE